VGVINYCGFFQNCTELTNASPWLDNVRFGAYRVIFDTIQEAIDAAAPGDTVWIPPGTYKDSGNVNLTFRGKNLVLKSLAGATTTVIDGSHGHRGFVSDQGEDSTSAVIGFTFRNCKATDQGSLSDIGGAVHVGSGSSIRFEDCVFLTSTASYGGAVHVAFEGEPTFRRCTFLQNTAMWGGGGIAAFGGAFDSCWILGNHAGSGGGVFVYNGQLSRCTIQANTASFGGGIYGYYSDFARFGVVEMRDCLVAGNTATIRGGGLDLHNLMHMSGTTVAGNFAELAGGMYTLYGGTVRRSIFWGNGADSSGADVFLSARVTFTCSAMDPSQLGGPGQAIFDGPQVFGDPLFCLPEFASSAPTTEGDYTLAINSPCLPFASPCDSLIGALDEGCGFVSVVPPPGPDEPPFLKTPGIHTGPNPFTQALTIHYLSPFGTDPQLEIYAVDGRLIGKWPLRPGSGVVTWDGRDPTGKPVASGIYLVRYQAGDLRLVRRVVRITR
ncbi:MAG TPA: right-handed parallel beta-helix repeat-containing protein, partial [Candidatus Eisenbacteria bacterium]|nr:right-handed parallel beta-helix repeat-containing protein [Candidatus Eisenbacteria bacterium]